MTKATRWINPLILVLTITCAALSHASSKKLSFELFADINSTTMPVAFEKRVSGLVFDGNLYFSHESERHGFELWVKPPGAQPELFSDINSGTAHSLPRQLKVVDDKLYFTATDSDGMRKLWFVDREKELNLSELSPSGNTQLDIANYLLTEGGVILLETHPSAGRLSPTLWQSSPDGSLSLLSNLPEFLKHSEVSNLIMFNGDLYVFLIRDAETDACLIRRYPKPVQESQFTDFACDELAFNHQLQVYDNRMYLKGDNNRLLEFDGESSPTPAFSGSAANGDMVLFDSALYVASVFGGREAISASGNLPLPYLYRIDKNGKTEITEPLSSNLEPESQVVDIAISAYNNLLYVAETSARYDGEIWLPSHTLISTLDTEDDSLEIRHEANQETLELGSAWDNGDLYLFDNEVCLGLNNFFCFNQSGEPERFYELVPESSAPSELSAAESNIYTLAAAESSKRQLVRIAENSQTILSTPTNNIYLMPIGSQLLMLERGKNPEIYVTGGTEGNDVESLSSRFPSVTLNTVAVTQAEDNAFILSHAEDDRLQVWRFDGMQTLELELTIDRDLLDPDISFVSNELYIFSTSLDEECIVYQYNENALVQIEPEGLADYDTCKSKVINIGGAAYVYYEGYKRSNNEKYSSLGSIDQQQINWVWQDQDIKRYEDTPVARLQNDLYFCASPKEFVVFRPSDQGEFNTINEFCPGKIILSSLDGEEKYYAYSYGENDLYQLTLDGLMPVTGLNAESKSIITDMVKRDDELILSAHFRDSNGVYGHELVRVFVPNKAVDFVASDEVMLEADDNTSGILLGQNLAVIDSDQGDTIRWSVEVAPEQGTLNGLPLEMSSTGETLYPDAISYTPPQDFSSDVSFQIAVSDGKTQDVLKISISASEAPSPPASAPAASQPGQKSSGGSLYILLALLLLLQPYRLRDRCIAYRFKTDIV